VGRHRASRHKESGSPRASAPNHRNIPEYSKGGGASQSRTRGLQILYDKTLLKTQGAHLHRATVTGHLGQGSVSAFCLYSTHHNLACHSVSQALEPPPLLTEGLSGGEAWQSKHLKGAAGKNLKNLVLHRVVRRRSLSLKVSCNSVRGSTCNARIGRAASCRNAVNTRGVRPQKNSQVVERPSLTYPYGPRSRQIINPPTIKTTVSGQKADPLRQPSHRKKN